MKLADWLTEKDVKRNEFARRLGVSPQLITGYCDGSIWPGKGRMRQIMRATDGAVTADDFVSDSKESAPLSPNPSPCESVCDGVPS